MLGSPAITRRCWSSTCLRYSSTRNLPEYGCASGNVSSDGGMQLPLASLMRGNHASASCRYAIKLLMHKIPGQMMLDFCNSMKRKRSKAVARPVRPVVPQVRPILEKRRSGRLQNQPAPSYNEAVLAAADAGVVFRPEGGRNF